MAKRKTAPSKARFIEKKIQEREYQKSLAKLRSGELDAQDFVQKYLIPSPGKKED